MIQNKEMADSFRIYFEMLWTQDVIVHKGFEGIRMTREKTFEKLKRGETLYVLGASTKTTEKFNAYWQAYHTRRVEAGIKSKMLWTEDARKFAQQRKALGLTEVRYLPAMMASPISIDIFNDVTAIDITSEKPFTIQIQNKEIADNFRKYFDMLWRLSKNIKTKT